MAKSTGPDKATRELVAARDGWSCVRCGNSEDPWPGWNIHHRLPRGMGGTSNPDINLPSNLLLLCHACHRYIELYRNEADANGWLVERHMPPAAMRPTAVAVRHAKHGWVYLDDEGGWASTGGGIVDPPADSRPSLSDEVAATVKARVMAEIREQP